MKSLKHNLAQIIKIFIGSLMIILLSPAWQARAEGTIKTASGENVVIKEVPGLSLSELGNLNGKYLSVFYVEGAAQTIGIKYPPLNILKVKAVQGPQKINGNAAINFPSVKVEMEKRLGAMPYNFIVFVVSSSDKAFKWVNADGSEPKFISGLSNGSNAESSDIRYVNKNFVDSTDAVSINGLDFKKISWSATEK